MRCEAHPEEEAVGTCKSCGRGVCTVCKVVFNGIIHCKACVEAGRISGGGTAFAPAPAAPAPAPTAYSYPYAYPGYSYPYSSYGYPPAVTHVPETPKPTGTPSRSFYLAGAAGGIIGGIMMLLAGGAMVWGLVIGANYPTDLWIAISVVVVLAATQMLSSVGLFGLYRNLGVQMGWISAGVLAAGAVIFPLMLMFAIPDYYQNPGYPYPYYTQYRFNYLETYLGAIALGTGIIVEGSAFLAARRFMRDPRPTGSIGTLLIVGGGLFAAFVGLFAIGWLLVAIARFISTPIYLGAPVPEKGPERALPLAPVKPAAKPGPVAAKAK
ncbi:MAG TPA: hypothetical protein VI893_08930 [Thermoplasmata archaeon]|nr:hypothetical protein [Thermoplasmata archaeon]